MGQRLENLVEVRIRHDYYRDLRCPDLRAVPTPATLALLRACRLQLRPRSDGFSLVGPVEVGRTGDERPRFPLEPGERLVFALALASPDFVHFTDLPLEAGSGRRLLLRNREGVSRLTSDSVVGPGDQVRLTGRRFSVRVPRSAAGAPVAVEDEAGRVLASVKVAPFTDDVLEIPLSLGEPGGLVRVRVGGRANPEPVFVDDDLPGMGAFALLELRPLGESWPPCSRGKGPRAVLPVQLTAGFRRRETRWRYHVVTPRGWPDADALFVRYPAETPPPYPAGVTFARATFPEISRLFPDKEVVSFESSLALPFHEGALRNTRLETPLRTVLSQLPGALRNTLNRTGATGFQLVSDIFVPL